METAHALRVELGDELFEDHNVFRALLDDAVDRLALSLAAPERKMLLRNVSWREESAAPVVAKVHKPGKIKPDPLRGRYTAEVDDKTAVVEYEADPELRDTEQIPLLEPGGIEAFLHREVLPYTPDAWMDAAATKIGYEISFTREFYQPKPLRSLEEIRADILALERESEGLLAGLLADEPS